MNNWWTCNDCGVTRLVNIYQVCGIDITESLVAGFKPVLFIFLLIAVLVWLVILVLYAVPYWTGSYYKATHKSFITLSGDTGAYGEYLCYRELKQYERDGAKFLFNCYLPKESDDTTEIDVMMISKSGIFVLESKNYSGWIFGSENKKNWTQSLPNGRRSIKNHFYNPIMQNRAHIKWLEKQVESLVPLHCLVVFSQRCELKDVTVNSGDVTVIKRDHLASVVREINDRVGSRLDNQQIEYIYNKLYPYTQVTQEVKEQHVARIKGVDTKGPTESKICPECGGTLVVKTVTEGSNIGHQYYGCTNPNCTCVMALSSEVRQ